MSQIGFCKERFLKKYEGVLWLIPFLIPYGIFTFAMLISSVSLSFTDYKILGERTFTGFSNYSALFTDTVYWQSLRNTVIYVLLSTPVLIIMPLIIGIAIEHKLLVTRGLFRTTFFAPYVLPVSVVAYTFLYMFQPYTGLINNLLRAIGSLGAKEELFWLMDTKLAWVTIILETLWWTGGFNMVIYISGMQEIPDQYYEATEIDGATYLQKVWYITLPLLNRVHTTVLFLQLVASFKVFGQVYLLTAGNPGGSTRTYIQYLFETGFRTFNIGRGSAAAIVLLLIIMLVSFVQFTVTSKFNKE